MKNDKRKNKRPRRRDVKVSEIDAFNPRFLKYQSFYDVVDRYLEAKSKSPLVAEGLECNSQHLTRRSITDTLFVADFELATMRAFNVTRWSFVPAIFHRVMLKLTMPQADTGRILSLCLGFYKHLQPKQYYGGLRRGNSKKRRSLLIAQNGTELSIRPVGFENLISLHGWESRNNRAPVYVGPDAGVTVI